MVISKKCKFCSEIKFKTENSKLLRQKLWGENFELRKIVETRPWTVDGRVDGWMDGWMEAKAGLRIAYSNQKFCLQKIPTDFSCCVPINNFCKEFLGICNKKSALIFLFFYRKKLRVQNFLSFYRKIFRAENILDRIKPWCLIVGKLC